jgi:hypothetical protein
MELSGRRPRHFDLLDFGGPLMLLVLRGERGSLLSNVPHTGTVRLPCLKLAVPWAATMVKSGVATFILAGSE